MLNKCQLNSISAAASREPPKRQLNPQEFNLWQQLGLLLSSASFFKFFKEVLNGCDTLLAVSPEAACTSHGIYTFLQISVATT